VAIYINSLSDIVSTNNRPCFCRVLSPLV